jgi:hypothetical protein
MKRIQLALLLVLIAAMLAGVTIGCSENTKLGRGDFFNMRKITVSVADREYLLTAARALLTREKYEKDDQTHSILYSNESRGVFIVLPRPNENALSTFGLGKGVMGALEAAAKKMRRLAANEDISQLKIRLDVVDETTDIKNHELAKRWNAKHRDRRGYIFDSNPPVAVLPDEMIQRNIMDNKGRFKAHRLKKIITDRGVGTKALNYFKKDGSIDYCLFTRFSFMEGDQGQLVPLLNGRPVSYSVDSDTLLERAILAGEYLKRAVNTDGTFNYVYYPHFNKNADDYNLLRHAGTAYAMTELYEITGDDKLLEKIKLAHTHLLSLMDGPNDRDKALGKNFQALYHPKKKEAKAGGAALCLIAFAKYTTVTGDKQHLPLMQDLARFIQNQTEENGHLISKYFKKPPAKIKDFDSIYYPGECVLALTRLYQIDGNKAWIETADKLVGFMVHIRDASLSIERLPHDHWLCIALNELIPILGGNEDYEKHAFKIGESIYRMMRKDGPDPEWVGSFYKPPRSTPSATRNEGVIALFRLADQLNQPTTKWYETARTIAGFDLRMQFTDMTGMFFKHPDKAKGAYPRSFVNPEIRIDYVQHNLSALLGLWKIQIEKQGKNLDDLYKGKAKHAGGEAVEEKPAA